MSLLFLVKFAALPAILGMVVWLGVIVWLRSRNFNPDGSRKTNRTLTDELRSKEIEYHNLATYRALEFYVKVLLAVLGGIAYIALAKSLSDKNARLLIDAAGWIVAFVSFLFCMMSLIHQKAKIERWKIRYRFFSPLMWNETWFFVLAILVVFFTRGLVNILLQKAGH